MEVRNWVSSWILVFIITVYSNWRVYGENRTNTLPETKFFIFYVFCYLVERISKYQVLKRRDVLAIFWNQNQFSSISCACTHLELCFWTLRIYVQNTDFKTLQDLKISDQKFYYRRSSLILIPHNHVWTNWFSPHLLQNSLTDVLHFWTLVASMLTQFFHWLSCTFAKSQLRLLPNLIMSIVLVLVIT